MDTIAIGKRLVEERNRRGETQQQVAEATGLSIAAIGMYERGERIPRDKHKIALADHFNCSVESLFFVFE